MESQSTQGETMTIDTLASFITYGGIAVPHDQREALIAALRVHEEIARDDLHRPGASVKEQQEAWDRSVRIEEAIRETECFLGMHKTPSPNPSSVIL